MVFFVFFFFFNGTATTGIYTYLHTLSLHDALPISRRSGLRPRQPAHNNMHPYPRHPARRGRSPDLRPGFDGLAIAHRNGLAVPVMAVDYHAFAADHTSAHQVYVASYVDQKSARTANSVAEQVEPGEQATYKK